MINQHPNDTITKNKIDRHLRDIHDTISEDDIKRVTTDLHSRISVIINNGIIEFPDQATLSIPAAQIKIRKESFNPWNSIT